MNMPKEAATPTNGSCDSDAAEELRAQASKLNFGSTISREFVHRKFIDHVLVTDLQKLDDDHFLCAGRLPQLHGYFNEQRKSPCCNIFSISEIARQASIAIGHRYLEIPAGFSQIMHRGNGQMEDPSDPRTLTPATSDFLLDIRLTDRRYRRSGELIGLNAEYSGYSEFSRVFHGCGQWTLVPQKVYQRLRHQGSDSTFAEDTAAAAASRTRLIEPSSVGRESAQHVVISRPVANASGSGGHSAYLIADSRHPYFFEHELDHVPGMLLLEGCNQFAVAIAAELGGNPPRDVLLKSYEMRFYRFAGLETPVRLEAPAETQADTSTDRGSLTFQITASQDQVKLAEFDMTVEPNRNVEELPRHPDGPREPRPSERVSVSE